ncbi:GlxA family transcriptional regulator [Bacterioplanoides pacificum]|uniref:GlxA family transcriptional regulator n=1 Tax=Bacterioplanoides pacificum TaxID=1171596 RepID=A0ABV7VS60_9GAMM
MKRCVILALDGCPLTSVTGPMEILLLARRLAEDSQWQVEVVAENGRQVQSSGGLQIVAHCDIREVDSADLLIVGAIDGPYLHQARVAAPTLAWVRQLHQQGCRMVSVCTGAYVLAAAGVLDGRQATSHWSVIDWLAQQFPDCDWQPGAMLTQDGQVACSGGASAYQDMSLLLVRQYFGEAIARQVAKSVLIDLDRHSQLQYASFMPQRQHQDHLIHQVQDWLEQHVCEQFTQQDLAELINLSERQFKRRFKQAAQQTPLAYIQALRMEVAKKALETSLKQVDVIARECGYEDVRFFRQLFKRHTGLAPSEYRSKFGS